MTHRYYVNSYIHAMNKTESIPRSRYVFAIYVVFIDHLINSKNQSSNSIDVVISIK